MHTLQLYMYDVYYQVIVAMCFSARKYKSDGQN